MIQRLIGLVITLIICGRASATEPLPLPKDVPPVLGMAVIKATGSGAFSKWNITLTLPKIAWDIVGNVDSKTQWPELKAEIITTTLTLQMSAPVSLNPSRVMDLKGTELSRDQVEKRLANETPVLVSVSGRMPDPYFLQLTTPDALIVILGPRDGQPAPELLQAQKASATKSNTGGK